MVRINAVEVEASVKLFISNHCKIRYQGMTNNILEAFEQNEVLKTAWHGIGGRLICKNRDTHSRGFAIHTRVQGDPRILIDEITSTYHTPRMLMLNSLG